MKDTYIDKIDNVDEIYAFVSYEEYLQLPAFKRYMEQRDLVPAKKITAEPQPVAEEKPRSNAAAVFTGIFGLMFVLWCLLGIATIFFADKLPTVVTDLFVGWTKDSVIVLAAIGAATILECISMIVAFARVKKTTGAFVGVMTFLAFVAIVASAVLVLVNASSVGMAFVVALALALIAFFISLLGNKKK